MIHLVEITAAVDSAGTTTVLRYSSGPGYAHPSAPGYYDERLTQPILIGRHAFAEGATSGRSSAAVGEIVLANGDGALDALADYGFDGRALRVLAGEPDAAYGTFTVVQVATMEQVELGWSEVRVRLRDRQAELSVPVQSTRYAGTNALPAGLEGVATDIQGQPKPLTLGEALRVPAPQVNTDRLIHQVHDGAVHDIPAVYVGAVALSRGVDYASQADMEANVPAAGQYRVWLGGGCFRLGTAPDGAVAADVQGDAAGGYVATAAGIMRRLVTGPGGIAAGDLVDGDFTALDVAAPATVGIYISSDRTVAEVLDDIAASVGAWWTFDVLGRFRTGRLVAPAGDAVAVLAPLSVLDAVDTDTFDLIALERVASADEGRGLPVWRVVVEYAKSYTVVSLGEASSSAPAAETNFVARELRGVTASDASVKDKHPLAPTLTRTTCLTSQADAEAEAARLLALYKVRRDTWRATIPFDAAAATVLDLGALVTLKASRLGLGAGRLVVILGLTVDAAAGTAELILWG